jgi:anti-anti-sigma factor
MLAGRTGGSMADILQFDVKYAGGVITAKAEGVLGFMTTPDLKKKINAWIDPGISHIILDLADINHVDSAGIAAILQASKTCKTAEVRLTLRNPPRALTGILMKSGLTELLSDS